MDAPPLFPPGQWCLARAVCDQLDVTARNFVDVGCGRAMVSRELCRRGLRGCGVDASPEALAVAATVMRSFIASGTYSLREGEVEVVGRSLAPADVVLSTMTLEHVADEMGFMRTLTSIARPGGQVLVAVQARRDRWSYEDEVAGHLRRYEREELTALLQRAALGAVQVWSVGVPVANLLFHAGDWLTRRATSAAVAGQSKREQTLSSGIRDIPWKTSFPSWCRVLLNPVALYPAFRLQRLFYRSKLGLALLGSGRVASA